MPAVSDVSELIQDVWKFRKWLKIQEMTEALEYVWKFRSLKILECVWKFWREPEEHYVFKHDEK